MTDSLYNVGKLKLANGTATWNSATIKVLGLGVLPTTPSQAYDPDVATVAALLALTGCAEATGTGYTRQTLSMSAPTQDNTNDRAAFDATDLTYTAANGWTLRALVGYVDGASDSLRFPIFYMDSGLPQVTNGGNLIYSFNAVGILTLT